MSACVSNPVDVKKQSDKISINTNINSLQSNNFSNDYILGKNDVYTYYFGDNSNNKDGISKELSIQAIKSLVESNKDIDINKSIETLIKRIGNINLIDTEYNEYFNLLIDYDEYTVRYTFDKYKSGRLGEPEGKILQSAFSKIAEDEYVKASAKTGKEYFDAFDRQARDLKKQNKLDYDFKLQYPYVYLYLTEYAK